MEIVVAAARRRRSCACGFADTGIGIAREDIGKLFVEFQQLDSGMARRYQGTGLGLALIKKIVEFQRGTISVESDVGQGKHLHGDTARVSEAAQT